MADLIYTLIIKDDGTAVVKKVTTAVQQMGQTTQQATQRASQGARQATHELSQMDRTLQRLQRTAAAFLGMWILTKAMALPKEAIESAIEFNSQIETAKLGIASILMAQGEFTNSVGGTVKGYDKLLVAQNMSGDIVKQLQIDNLKTIATFDQLVKAFQQTLAPALERGFNVQQVRQYTTAMVQAAGALGLNLDMLAEETRSMLRGTITPRQTLIATALGITNEDIRRFQGNADALFKYIMGKLEAFRTAGIESQTTWLGLLSNLKDAVKMLLGAGFENLFKFAKEEAKSLMDAIVVVDEATGEMRLNPELVASLKEVGYLFQTLYVTIKDILEVIDSLRQPVNLIAELWRSIAISANAWADALGRGGKEQKGQISILGMKGPVEPEWFGKYRGKGMVESAVIGLRDFNDWISGESAKRAKAIRDQFEKQMSETRFLGAYKYVPTPRALKEDEINYMMSVASEIGDINDALKERLKIDMDIKEIDVDLESLSGRQLQAALKSISEYKKLSDTGRETLESFTKLLAVRLRIAAIEMMEAPLKIAQQVAQSTDQYALQEETLRTLNRLDQEKLSLVKQLTPELKKQMDLQLSFQTAEIDRARRAGILERQKDLITLRQTYANITGDIEGQLSAMQSLTDIEVGQLMIQIERTKDLEKQKDLWDKIAEVRKVSAKQQEQFRITAPIEQRAPMYAAGLGLATAVGNLMEYERISKLILNDEIASLKAKGENNRYLQDLINYKEQQWKIDLAIQKVEMELYAPDKLAQVAGRYAEMTGDIQAQDRASQMLLAGELKRLQTDAKLSEDQKIILSGMFKQIEASEAINRNLSKEREILGWRQQTATLQGNYLKGKQLEIELLKSEELQLIENNKNNLAAVEAIKEYYGLQIAIIEAQKNMDFSKLVDFGAQQGVLRLNQQLADSYQNILPNSVGTFGNSVGDMLDQLGSGTVNARDALMNFLTSISDGFRRLIIDIGMTIAKMEILKALGYGGGGEKSTGTGIFGSLLGVLGGGGGDIGFGAGMGFEKGGIISGKPIPLYNFQEGGMLKTTSPTLFATSERGGTEYIIPEDKMGKSSGKPVALTIVNVVDQRQLDMYMASSRGQDAVVNSVGSKIGTIKRMLR